LSEGDWRFETLGLKPSRSSVVPAGTQDFYCNLSQR
jgi:hypothetical protein